LVGCLLINFFCAAGVSLAVFGQKKQGTGSTNKCKSRQSE
jgi:hypothetical protein